MSNAKQSAPAAYCHLSTRTRFGVAHGTDARVRCIAS